MAKYRFRTLGGSLLVIKGSNDCATIKRGANGKPYVSSTDGAWTAVELSEAKHYWFTNEGREARSR